MPATLRGFSYYQSFTDCQKKFFYSNILQLQPITVSTPLSIGTGVHAGLASWYMNHDEKLAYKAAMEAYDADNNGLVYRDGQVEEIESMTVQLLSTYFNTYPTEPFQVISCEQPFTIILKGDVIYTVKLDAFAVMDGLKYVIENKTTSRTPDQYFPHFELDGQTTGYVLAASRHLHEDIAGVIVNLLKKPTAKQPPMAYRDIFRRTSQQLSEYEDEIVAKDMAIRTRLASAAPWEKNTKECHRVGQYTCQYKPLCMGTVDQLEEFYIKRDISGVLK